jgi:hypothetical protein
VYQLLNSFLHAVICSSQTHKVELRFISCLLTLIFPQIVSHPLIPSPRKPLLYPGSLNTLPLLLLQKLTPPLQSSQPTPHTSPTSSHTSNAKPVSPEPVLPTNPFYVLSSEPNPDPWDACDQAVANEKSPHKKSKIDAEPSVPTEETRANVAVVEPLIAQSEKDARQG